MCSLALGGVGSAASHGDEVKLTMLAYVAQQAAWDAVLQNFERGHPNITVDVAWAPTVASVYQLETTEFAAGHAPDLLSVYPGCGTPISICKLAKAGYLAPMLHKAWAKTLDPRVLSYSKYGPTLFMYEPTEVFDGLLTNDSMFKKLGLKVPQTFPQLLTFCQKAKSAGTTPILLTAQGTNTLQQLIADIALTTVYAKDQNWAKKLRAGKVTFSGTAGWHQALGEVVEMSNAGCFQQGPASTTGPGGDAVFAQGQVLTYPMTTGHKGSIDAAHPQFKYSQQPFPAAGDAARNNFLLQFPIGRGVNAHSSPQNQAAAQLLVDFVARPDQDALFAAIDGGLSEQQLEKGRFPGYLSTFLPLYKQGRFGINPIETWWNASVGNALTTYATGLLTGQTSIDDVLKAMDTAWQLGPD